MIDLPTTEWYHPAESTLSCSTVLFKQGWILDEDEFVEYVTKLVAYMRADTAMGKLCDNGHSSDLLQGQESTTELRCMRWHGWRRGQNDLNLYGQASVYNL
eukprot:TRINITY_DN422_c0_g2_i3.p1 TRINITY_DN422_c0_g2~~TRINITY_DN422_c0_g2_i3.p1  ORF type:complete len:101 (-),score=15.60 TRINITY_DN422_c0_g2_i3:141-443(-)